MKLEWITACSGDSGACVALAAAEDGKVALTNTSDPNSPVLLFDRSEIRDLIRGAKEGIFDELGAE